MKFFFEGALDRAANAEASVAEFRTARSDNAKNVSDGITVHLNWKVGVGTQDFQVHVMSNEVTSRMAKYLAQHLDAAMDYAVADLRQEAEKQLVLAKTDVQGYLDQINEIEAARGRSANDA